MDKYCKSIIKDIKSIKIQGATNIAKASISALSIVSAKFIHKTPSVFIKEIEKIANKFAWARPDEPLNQNLIKFIIAKIKADQTPNIKDKIIKFQDFCCQALSLISENEQLITAEGVKLIRKISLRKQKNKKDQRAVNIFTICRSSSVANILIKAHKIKIPIKIYNSETRPRYQGRILSKILIKCGIDVTMMTDSAAPFIISKNDPEQIDIDLVIIGADVLSADGSILNKIGSYSTALAAKNAHIPFYVVSSLLKLKRDVKSYRHIKIEKRDPTELWQKSPKGMKVLNYAFDTVPHNYITGFITEVGIIKPTDVKMKAKKEYKEIFGILNS